MKNHQKIAHLLIFVVGLGSYASAFVLPSPSSSIRNPATLNWSEDKAPLFAVQNSNEQSYNTGNDKKPCNSMNHRATSFLLGVWMAIALPFGLGGDVIQPPIANAADAVAGARIVGQLKGSGLVFKDTLQIESFNDPKVKGVTLYISTFQRPLTERLTKSFMTDPSDASVGCAKTGPVEIADNIAIGTGGEEVFEESKSLLFKTLRVYRIYDKEKNTVLYISFNTRLDKNDDSNKSRFKSSLCAVNLD